MLEMAHDLNVPYMAAGVRHVLYIVLKTANVLHKVVGALNVL